MFTSDYVPPTIYTVSDGEIWLEVRSPTLTPEALQEVAASAIARADEVLGQ
jgi:hypothetical protein